MLIKCCIFFLFLLVLIKKKMYKKKLRKLQKVFKTFLFIFLNIFSHLGYSQLLIPLSRGLSLQQIHFCAYLRFSCEYFLLNDLMFHKFLSRMGCMLFSGCSLCRNIYDRLKNVSYVCIGLNHAQVLCKSSSCLKAHSAIDRKFSTICIIIILIKSCKHGKLLASN